MSPMASSPFHYFLLFLLILSTLATGSEFFLPKEKYTHLRMFLHEVSRGPNATIYTIASFNNNSPYSFGDINVTDATLRQGPEPSSRLIGRVQGFEIGVDMDRKTLQSVVTLKFTAGEYEGSAISLLGVVFLPTTSERSVIGGAGQFRMARGFSFVKLISSTEDFLIAEIDVYVAHHAKLLEY
ncbi:pterocarpan synthase 1-like [Typha angustifolia]|uniref:pterocarpan synthase 1-like n=1 Tax=Typha angustifolia TaxID=59011 RepID=UPI003C2C7298